MDRPEWIAIDQKAGEVYCTLTNNTSRGQPNFPGVDAANPRANNTMGQRHPLEGRRRLRRHDVHAGTTSCWPATRPTTRAEAKGNVKGDIFGCPDGLVLDARGVLWIQTDAHATQMYKGEFAEPRQQPDAGLRPRHRRDPALPHRPGQLRDHRRHADARRTHDVHQHPAPGRDAERPQRPGRPGQVLAAGPTSSRAAGRARPRW